METANSRLLDQSISHSIGLQRLSTGIVRRIISTLNRVDDDLVRQLQRYDPTAVGGSYSQKRLEKLLEAVRVVNKEAYAVLRKELDGELRGLAAYEAEFQGRMIAGAAPVRLDIVTPSASQLYAAVQARPFQGILLREWYQGLEQNAQTRLRNAIRTGFVEGESIEQMIRRVRGTRAAQYRDGVLEINRRGAEMVVRTAVNHTANVARSETYRENSDVIKGVRWVSTLDSRTCFVAGTEVETPDGARAIETLRPGEAVIGGSRQVRRIIGTSSARKTTMARVTLSNGQTVTCTADHLFRTPDGNWKEAKDLAVGEPLARVL